MRDNYAIFRYPDTEECYILQCNNEDLVVADTYLSIDNIEGFVFAPFHISKSTPVIIIKNSTPEKIHLPELRKTEHVAADEKSSKQQYSADFRKFYDFVDKGHAGKVVLARSSTQITDEPLDAMAMFTEACRNNPHAFTALVHNSVSGTWLMSTPEILLEHIGNDYHTMALAGTMLTSSLESGMCWSDKNIEEQKYVADYIRNAIKPYSNDIIEKGPYTSRSGNVSHLRTDFLFRSGKKEKSIGEIVSRLHPTPAVCGLPVSECETFIMEVESCEREYYSGFCGVVTNQTAARLYVTLRCMKINGNELTLYAGGGILRGSKLEEEWNETINKMQAMKNCIIKEVKDV